MVIISYLYYNRLLFLIAYTCFIVILKTYNRKIEENSNGARVVRDAYRTAFIRKLPAGWEVSDEAKNNAGKLGVIIQDVYTFVREHVPTDNEEDKTNVRNAGRKAYSNDKVIKMIYNLYLNGKSLQLIADELNRSEIKTNRGKDWSKSSVRFILLNPRYIVDYSHIIIF